MNLKKQIAAALLLSITAAAHATNWTIVASGDEGSVMVDRASIARSGAGRTAWVKIVTNSDGSYTIADQLFNCRSRYTAIYSVTFYDAGGNVTNSLAPSSANVPMTQREVIPDSNGESILNYVCAH